MRIRIVITPDVAHEHGITKGRVFEVTRTRPAKGRLAMGYWVRGDAGKPVLVLAHEACVYPEGWE